MPGASLRVAGGLSAGPIALLFAADHYFFKTDENVWHVITLVSLSLLLSYSVFRTGSLRSKATLPEFQNSPCA